MGTGIIQFDAKQIINEQLPAPIRSKMCAVVEQGYDLTKEAIRHTTILNWDLGMLHEGYLRNLAIAYLFHKNIELNQLPLTYTYEYNHNHSYKYLVLAYNQMKMTLSQVATRYDIARPAYFRDKLQMANQATMFFSDIDDIESIQAQHYLLLTYSRGGDAPKFVNIGFPHLWRERIDLLKEPHIIAGGNEEEKEEIVTAETLIEFRNFTKEVGILGGQ
ncbi:hypothetical protein [Paenibacillus apis]|uniref:Uncharacterized protein n=1 Tax=Paenibacillus apis TaxID=1792174 RepID=A0A919Y6T9_9BACL|nr:hypothetical protein [Paenibacillus apis]GIO43162.1 hypothetical protein J41TS4_29200 [Paenibacillus apis]